MKAGDMDAELYSVLSPCVYVLLYIYIGVRVCAHLLDENPPRFGPCSEEASSDHDAAGVCHRLQRGGPRHEMQSLRKPSTHVSQHQHIHHV